MSLSTPIRRSRGLVAALACVLALAGVTSAAADTRASDGARRVRGASGTDARRVDPARDVSVGDRLTADPIVIADPAARARADKLARAAEEFEEARRFEPSDPYAAPELHTLGCGVPLPGPNESFAGPFYRIELTTTGGFTAETGASHPVTLAFGPQDVIFPGPTTSDVTFRVHNSAGGPTSYLDPSGGSICPYNPPDAAGEPNSDGFEQEWVRSGIPIAGGGTVDLELRMEMLTFGTTPDDSGIRISLGARNLPSSTADAVMGVRFQIDHDNGPDDGPLFAPVICDPFTVGPETGLEHDFTAAEIAAMDFYRIQNNDGMPVFADFISVTDIPGFPGTAQPDRLVYGQWSALSGSAWNYAAVEGRGVGGVGPGRNDSAVLVYFGYLPADGIVLAPGESFQRSVVIFTAADAVECTLVPPPADCCDPCELTPLLLQALPGMPELPSTHPCFGVELPSPPTEDCCITVETVVAPAMLPSSHPCFVPPMEP